MSECKDCGNERRQVCDNCESCSECSSLSAELSQLRSEMERVKVERDALKDNAIKVLLDGMVIKKMSYEQIDGKGEFDMTIASPFCGVLAKWIKADFEIGKAENYLERTLYFGSADGLGFNVLIQKVGGKTPAQINGELQKKLTASESARRVLVEEIVARRRKYQCECHQYDIGEDMPGFSQCQGCQEIEQTSAAVDASGVLTSAGGE